MKPTIRTLFINIPDVPPTAGFEFHPISWSDHPRYHRPEELGDTGDADNPWIRFFEEILMGIYWKYEKPVPFAFKTANGKVRSLDAGCIKWLLNRKPPEVNLLLGEDRTIQSVLPSNVLVARYLPEKDRLIELISSKRRDRI